MQGEGKEVSGHDVLGYYKGKLVLEHYEEATRRVGMWASEELVFRQTFPDREASLLELGCGTGRICLSLWMSGYGNLTATDFSKPGYLSSKPKWLCKSRWTRTVHVS